MSEEKIDKKILDWDYKMCRHPEHKPPSHICIPFNEKLEHTCPSCGNKQIVISERYTLGL